MSNASPAQSRARASASPVERRGYLIDNSILQKLARSANIRRRFEEITHTYPIYTFPPRVLEYCWSARNPAVHMQEYGLYDFENPAETSVALATELESVRS